MEQKDKKRKVGRNRPRKVYEMKEKKGKVGRIKPRKVYGTER